MEQQIHSRLEKEFPRLYIQGCILSPCLFSLYAEYILWNAGLDEAQAGIKIPGRNSNNLRCADDTILMAESEAEAEAPILWLPDAKSWLIGKDPDAGKDWGQEEKREAEDEIVG